MNMFSNLIKYFRFWKYPSSRKTLILDMSTLEGEIISDQDVSRCHPAIFFAIFAHRPLFMKWRVETLP